LSRSLTDRNTLPSSGKWVAAPICALAKAMPKSADTPITSPVERISGPSAGSSPGNRTKGNTDSLTNTPLTAGSSRSPSSASVLPVISRAAMPAIGTPLALATNGTVRLARGLTSRT